MERKKKRTGFVPRMMVSGLAGAVPACVAVASVDCGKTDLVALAIASFDAHADAPADAHADTPADVHESEPMVISLAVASFDAGADADSAVMVISLAVASFDAAADGDAKAVLDATVHGDAADGSDDGG